MYENFVVEHDGPVAEVRFNRGAQLNALSERSFAELAQIMTELDATGRTRAIVLSAEGKHFCAGLDLNLLRDAPERAGGQAPELGRQRAMLRELNLDLLDRFRSLEEIRIPVLAAIQGGAVGAGFDLTTYADMRYATADAFFCIQQINVGMVADMGVHQRLARLMPEGVVRELSYTGRRMGAEEAARRGYVNDVFVTRDAMLEAVRGIAHTIADKSPLAVWGSKEMLNYGRDHSFDDGRRHLAMWTAGMFHTTDISEGYRAFTEKRPARYPDLPARRI